MKQKIVSYILILTICLSLLPAGVWAIEAEHVVSPTVTDEGDAPAEGPEVSETPSPTPSEEPPVETPEVSEAPAPSEEPSVEEPVVSEAPVPSEKPSPLSVQLSSNVRCTFAGEGTIGLTLQIDGGAPEYSVTYQVLLNGAVVERSETKKITVASDSYSYAPKAAGTHTLSVTVTDSAGQTATASVSVSVAVHDTTSAQEMRDRANGVTLTGDWRVDIVEIARSQVGYHESSVDFIIRADGSTQGYTVYGAWYGYPYEEWCAMFVAYCTDAAGISAKNLPRSAGCLRLMWDFTERGVFETRSSGYTPVSGDIILFNWDGDAVPDHVGIVEYVTDSEVHTIEGNSSLKVSRVTYALSDSRIMGYGNVTKMMIQAGVLDPEVEETQALIDALPSVEEVRAMDLRGKRAACKQFWAAYDAYTALSQSQRDEITGAETLDALSEYFGGLKKLLFSGGGTEQSPYLISSADDLKWLAEDVNRGNDCAGLYFRMTQDIDLKGSQEDPWTPIGTSSDWTVRLFSGSFDGDGHEITGLYLNAGDWTFQGLFGAVGGLVKHVGVSEAVLSGSAVYAGGVAGYNDGGTVENCYVTGTVTGSGAVGGIVGSNFGTVKNCYYTGNVAGDMAAGGVVGLNATDRDKTGKVENCYSIGSVSGTQDSSVVGGVVGYAMAKSTVKACYFSKEAAERGIGYGSGSAAAIDKARLAAQETFPDWDFDKTWRIHLLLGRPVLTANPETVLISDVEMLEAVRDYVNAGSGKGERFRLKSDLTLSGTWTPIGNAEAPFRGVFDGGEHIISGFYMDPGDILGFFGVVGENGVIRKLGVSGFVSGGMYTGGVAGYNLGGTIDTCYYTGAVSGSEDFTSGYVGGIVGCNDGGTVQTCYNAGTVFGGGGIYIGGVAGYNSGVVQTSCCTGAVTDGLYAGGIVGYNCGTVRSSYNLIGDAIGRDKGTSEQVVNKTADEFISGKVTQLVLSELDSQN